MSKRASELFLETTANGRRNWGYTIYRTTYTPASETLFPRALEKLTAYIQTSINYELDVASRNGQTLHPAPCQKVIQTYKPEIFSDASKFDGSSIEEIRAHYSAILDEQFEQLASETGPPEEVQFLRKACCIVLDDETMTSIIEGADVTNELPRPKPIAMAKVLDGRYDLERGPEASAARGIEDTTTGRYPYHGWVMVPCRFLWYIYDQVSYGGNLEHFTGVDKQGKLIFHN